MIVLMIDAAVTWKAEISTFFAAWWIYFLPNASRAFQLNVTISLLIDYPVFVFTLAGLVKDAVRVRCVKAVTE